MLLGGRWGSIPLPEVISLSQSFFKFPNRVSHLYKVILKNKAIILVIKADA
jgi:hypothetical protein